MYRSILFGNSVPSGFSPLAPNLITHCDPAANRPVPQGFSGFPPEQCRSESLTVRESSNHHSMCSRVWQGPRFVPGKRRLLCEGFPPVALPGPSGPGLTTSVALAPFYPRRRDEIKTGIFPHNPKTLAGRFAGSGPVLRAVARFDDPVGLGRFPGSRGVPRGHVARRIRNVFRILVLDRTIFLLRSRGGGFKYPGAGNPSGSRGHARSSSDRCPGHTDASSGHADSGGEHSFQRLYRYLCAV